MQNEAIDYQVESQRGMFVCGIPLFTSNWMLPCDPHAFTNLEGNLTGQDLRQLQVPNPEWEWVWPNWVIDMNGPVDYHGWSYNLWFTAEGWHDGNRFGRCFVRQRRWIRKRRIIKVQEEALEEIFDATDVLYECRNDRERTEALLAYISEDTVDSMIACKAEIVSMYQFPSNLDGLYAKLGASDAGRRFVAA